jgi:hypothetical protein
VLQAAWSAISLALEAAVRAGADTDTVAAIAGALLGARWGCSTIPPEWQQVVHGWPGMTGADLVWLAVSAARAGAMTPTAGGSRGALGQIVDLRSPAYETSPAPNRSLIRTV